MPELASLNAINHEREKHVYFYRSNGIIGGDDPQYLVEGLIRDNVIQT